jgi:hypothetical protein
MDTSSTLWLTRPLSLRGIYRAKVGNFILPFLGILMLPMTQGPRKPTHYCDHDLKRYRGTNPFFESLLIDTVCRYNILNCKS